VDRALDLPLGVAVGRLRLAADLVCGALVAEIRVAGGLAHLLLHAALGLIDAALHLVLVHAVLSLSCTRRVTGSPHPALDCRNDGCPLLSASAGAARRKEANAQRRWQPLAGLLGRRLHRAADVERREADLQDNERPRARV